MKGMLEAQQQLSLVEYRLMFNGGCLDDGRTMEHYGLNPKSTVEFHSEQTGC
jgi:hypothetical protein